MIEKEAKTEAPIEAPTETLTEAPTEQVVQPAPLVSETYVPTEEETMFRSRIEPHRRLTRRHKPPVTQERLDEVRVRLDEVKKLREQQAKIREEVGQAKEAKDEAAEAAALTRIAELDKLVAERHPGPIHAIQFRLAERFGLLDEEDLARLRRADVRRGGKRSRMLDRARRGEFKASERATLLNTPPPKETAPSA